MKGEDGQDASISLDTILSQSGSNSWSYKSALKILQENDDSASSLGMKVSQIVERTNVADIIAAARRSIRKKDSIGIQKSSSNHEVCDDPGLDETESNGSYSDSSEDDNIITGDSDQQEDLSSDDEVDDADNANKMDHDIIRERQEVKKGNRNDTCVSQDNNNGDDDNEDDGDNSQYDSSESFDEEDKIEAAKADKYFDHSQHTVNFYDGSVDVFAQLNLSRPLLRGVASVGFVTPTPIQAKVIPVALAGRDVCAR